MRALPAGRSRGFTLIEAMITVAIVAILATIAVSSYRSYILRANRTEARSAILRIQVAQEKFFLQNNTYTTNFTDAPPDGLGLGSATTANGYYELEVTAGSTGSIATSFIATATAAGTQERDTAACRVFTIDDTGARTPAADSDCWK